MNPFLKSVTLAALVIGSLTAAIPANAESASNKKPSLFFEVIYWGSWMDKPLKYKSGDELKAIALQNGDPTCYLYSGPSPLVLYREESKDPKTGELKPVPILSLPFEISWGRAALLITPGKDNKLNALMVPLTEDTFPTDSAYLYNSSGKKLKCKLADKTWEMEDQQKELFPMNAHDAKIYLLAASEWHESWQVMYSDSFRPREGERRIVYFYTPKETEGVSAMLSVIPPDSDRFDSEGKPIESATVDPNFNPGANPSGTTEIEGNE